MNDVGDGRMHDCCRSPWRGDPDLTRRERGTNDEEGDEQFYTLAIILISCGRARRELPLHPLSVPPLTPLISERTQGVPLMEDESIITW